MAIFEALIIHDVAVQTTAHSARPGFGRNSGADDSEGLLLPQDISELLQGCRRKAMRMLSCKLPLHLQALSQARTGQIWGISVPNNE